MLFDLPIWVLICIVLIIASGYMAIRAMKAERLIEQQFIEKEGQVYLKRIEKEKEKRAMTSE